MLGVCVCVFKILVLFLERENSARFSGVTPDWDLGPLEKPSLFIIFCECTGVGITELDSFCSPLPAGAGLKIQK